MPTYGSTHTGSQIDSVVNQILNKTEKVTWGNIEGTISNQADLQALLDSKYDTSNPSNYATESYVDEKLTGVENLLKEI